MVLQDGTLILFHFVLSFAYFSFWKCLEHRQPFIETNKQSAAARENRTPRAATSLEKETKLPVQQPFG